MATVVGAGLTIHPHPSQPGRLRLLRTSSVACNAQRRFGLLSSSGRDHIAVNSPEPWEANWWQAMDRHLNSCTLVFTLFINTPAPNPSSARPNQHTCWWVVRTLQLPPASRRSLRRRRRLCRRRCRAPARPAAAASSAPSRCPRPCSPAADCGTAQEHHSCGWHAAACSVQVRAAALKAV